MTDRNQEILTDRDEIEAMLPFYLNGTLSPEDAARVERRLAEDAELREQAEFSRRMKDAVDADSSAIEVPDLDFDRLMSRIEREDRIAAIQRRSLGEWISEWAAALIGPLAPPAVRFTMAAAAVVIALQGVAIFGLIESPGGDTAYRAASGTEGPAAAAGPRLTVVFQDSASIAEVQDLLGEIDGRIVAGPTDQGVYVVELRDTALGAPEIDERLQQVLQRSDIVRFAGRGL